MPVKNTVYVDKFPVPFSHGTQCASVAAGRANNSQCVVGVAFDAKIAGM